MHATAMLCFSLARRTGSGTNGTTIPSYVRSMKNSFVAGRPICSRKTGTDLTFLDVGCGMGRNSYWPMAYGAASGLAIDIDDRSLAAARQTLASFAGMRIEN